MERREDLCMNGLKNTIETYGLLEPNPPPFQNTAIDHIRILCIELDRACNGGSCVALEAIHRIRIRPDSNPVRWVTLT